MTATEGALGEKVVVALGWALGLIARHPLITTPSHCYQLDEIEAASKIGAALEVVLLTGSARLLPANNEGKGLGRGEGVKSQTDQLQCSSTAKNTHECICCGFAICDRDTLLLLSECWLLLAAYQTSTAERRGNFARSSVPNPPRQLSDRELLESTPSLKLRPGSRLGGDTFLDDSYKPVLNHKEVGDRGVRGRLQGQRKPLGSQRPGALAPQKVRFDLTTDLQKAACPGQRRHTATPNFQLTTHWLVWPVY